MAQPRMLGLEALIKPAACVPAFQLNPPAPKISSGPERKSEREGNRERRERGQVERAREGKSTRVQGRDKERKMDIQIAVASSANF